MEFVFFRFRRTDKMGLGGEGADEALPFPRILGLEPPLVQSLPHAPLIRSRHMALI